MTSPTSVRVLATAILMVVCARSLGAQDNPARIPLFDPRLKLIQVVPAQPVAGVYANGVTADVVVGVDGGIETVTVIEGQKAHYASAIAALKQYRFAPVVIDGKAVRFVTRLSVHVPDLISNDALRQTIGAGTSTTVPARRDVTLLGDCSRALITQDGSPQAIQTCRDAVAASDQAGVNAFAPRSARRYLGDVYLFAKRWSDAITTYQSALSITTPTDASDLGAGEILLKIAIAQGNLDDLAAADRSAASATAVLQASMAAHPDERREHVDLLRLTLLFQARIKQVRGDDAAARDLERRAEALDQSK